MAKRFARRSRSRTAARRSWRWLALPLALVVGVILGFGISAVFMPPRPAPVNVGKLPQLIDPQRQASVPLPRPPAHAANPTPSPGTRNGAPPAAVPSPRQEPASPVPPQAIVQPQPTTVQPQPTTVQPQPTTVQPPAIVPPPPVTGQAPAWRRYAVAVPNTAGKAMIAVVIDDMGLDQRRSAAVAELPAPLTLSYLPYGRDLPRQTAAARRNGHELMVHVPMQPQGAGNNPGPNALTTDLTPVEIKRRLDLALGAFDGYVGINNHMGSRFTTDRAGMDAVMAELKARGLLFIDSRTGPHSVGASAAAAYQVPTAGRHVFLDNELSAAEVTHQLAETERIARQSGLAIAIGHPHDVTIAALKAWLPTLREKGFVQVPVSAAVARLDARRNATAAQTTAVPSHP